MIRRFVGFAVVATVLAGCGGGDGIPTVLAASIEIASGNNQSGPANARLAEPLVARVRDASGAVLGRVTVEWSISPAGGSLSSPRSLSDVDGEARVDVVLGPVGPHSIMARVSGSNLAQQFLATATDPPALTSLVPSTFGPGEIVVANGTNLGGGTPEVTVGGAVGPIVTATPTSITFEAPSCLSAGSQPVVARVGTATTNALTASYQPGAAPLTLAVGQYVSIDPAEVAGCARFAAPAGTEEYVLISQATTKLPGLTTTFRLGGAAVPLGQAVEAAVAAPPTFALQFHDRVRALEREHAQRGAAGVPGADERLRSARAAVTTVPTVGSSRTFSVCGSYENCSPFKTVTATARHVGQRVAIYLDDDVPAGGLTDADIGELADEFDTRLYPEASRAFGSESDIDGNGVVIVLMTDAVNELTPMSQCSDSFIGGFFFALDLLPNQPNSNAGEIFYSFVADPNGTVSCRHTITRVKRQTPSTFIHELQHMISWNQRVTIRGSALGEETWLEEGLSHYAEELGGRIYLAEGDTMTFSDFAGSNLVFAFRYFKAPTFFLLVPDADAPTTEYRGASWSFVRWLVDQFGVDVTRRLVETGFRGGTNVEAATGESFSRLVAEWGLTVWVDDLPGFSPPPRLRYTSWDLRTTYAAMHMSAPSTIDRPFPIEPPLFTDGRLVTINGILRSGTPNYVLISLAPGAAAFALEFTDGGGLPLPSTATPRLTVIRTR